MRIAIDVSAAFSQRAGIGRYVRGLLSGLAKVDGHDYALFLAAGVEPLPSCDNLPLPHHAIVRCPLGERILNLLWHRLGLRVPVDVWIGTCDVFHSPDFTLPPTRARTVVTIHDLSFMTVPQLTRPELRTFLERSATRAIRRADHVLADSESTRSDLVRLLDVPSDKVSVAYPGVDSRFRPLQRARLVAVSQRYGLPERFILGVGSLHARKNWVGLIEAFALARRSYGLTHDLVIAGPPEWGADDILAAPRRFGVSEHVMLCGYVDEVDLPGLFNLADAFALPSRYEGFGLPAIEALACGVPTVVSNTSSLPEVVGQAALTVEPADVAELAHALLEITTDEELRARLRRDGPKRAAHYTWTAMARCVLQAYESTGISAR